MATVAERLFDAKHAECEIESALEGVDYEHLGWDDYDGSLEIHGAASDFRLSEELAEKLFGMGFGIIFVNHVDAWETHYNKGRPPWRVSYPHKRGDGSPAILVEEVVSSWPAEWFQTGYARVREGA
jgi:hypothetical protein